MSRSPATRPTVIRRHVLLAAFVAGLFFAAAIEAQPLVIWSDGWLEHDGQTPEAARDDKKAKKLALETKVLGRRHWDQSLADIPSHVTTTLGRHRWRDLNAARIDYELTDLARAWGPVEPTDAHMEDMEDTVLSAYVKLQRENLNRRWGLEAWFDRKIGRDGEPEERQQFTQGRSYKLRFSPQADVGSRGHVSAKIRMPYTKTHFFDHLSFRVRHYYEQDRMTFVMNFDDHSRHFRLAFEPETEEFGDRWLLQYKIWF